MIYWLVKVKYPRIEFAKNHLGVSENSGFYPQIIHFNRVFHYKPSILGYPYFWKHPFRAAVDVTFLWGWYAIRNFPFFCVHILPYLVKTNRGKVGKCQKSFGCEKNQQHVIVITVPNHASWRANPPNPQTYHRFAFFHSSHMGNFTQMKSQQKWIIQNDAKDVKGCKTTYLRLRTYGLFGYTPEEQDGTWEYTPGSSGKSSEPNHHDFRFYLLIFGVFSSMLVTFRGVKSWPPG